MIYALHLEWVGTASSIWIDPSCAKMKGRVSTRGDI